MQGRRWTDEEILMIKNGMKNQQIAVITGRTVKAVEMKRYKLTGKCEAPRDSEVSTESKAKEFRILNIKMLAQKLGVKLFGKDE